MAKPLPFVTAPAPLVRRVGNPATGVLELPVVGDLSVNESQFIAESVGKCSSFVEIAKLSNKIAKIEKMAPLAAHRFISQCIASALGMGDDPKGKAAEIHENRRLKFAEEIEALTLLLTRQQWRRQVAMATAMIRYRVPGCEGYTEEDMQKEPESLVLALAQFAMEEQVSRMETPTEAEADAETAEGLGK
jgi:hypothetical protein